MRGRQRPKTRAARRERRHRRVRQRVIGTAERPRLVVYRSLKHIYAQIVDDERGATVVAASDLGATLEPAAPGKEGGASGKAGVARAVGRLIAARAKEAGIRRVVFDRAGYLYHGRIKALADGARAGGLEF